ncbi:YHS domain-containing (seleno)protein [Tamlana sp. 2201CG12-4]|uniref:YHS domain-containing (seleno)protein n=1 Tax=Tamlana sp. 2201CG12-4 TaxID=3112582 RepID=UPI002DB59506|nr:YHS domain-containing (seleno)protein [Tamlana sp. 2201CG12-4]MEC3906626.1 YHS domain-containing (seleno)protein [Tamlana sp. 2201CG12-4]
MKSLILLFTIVVSSLTAQTTDYNLKKGFIANGYDVVSYFNNQAIEGSKKFTSVFDGVNYKFSSEKNLYEFNKNPEKYVPQYGGYCAYAIALKGDKVSINPEAYLIDKGKLYLFYNAWGTNTLKLWQQKDQELLKEKADEHWKKIKFEK